VAAESETAQAIADEKLQDIAGLAITGVYNDFVWRMVATV
jgi:hypothetical protein